MDLSKAHHFLPHDILIVKFSVYGFEDSTTSLISDYFSERYHWVKIGFIFSFCLEILRGIPHSSILGPIVFNIFLNDLILHSRIRSLQFC